MVKLPDFEATSADAIPGIHATLTGSFASHKTVPVEFRKKQLRKLYWAVRDNESRMVEALRADLGKPEYEAHMVEISWVLNDILFMLDNIDKWIQDESPPTGLKFAIMSPKLRKEPMGGVLIIGAFNYPFQLVLAPAVGAIAAGCTVAIKPSELAPRSAAVLTNIIKNLDKSCYTVVNGAVPETSKLLELKWDKIMYTGNTAVAQIILAAAAKHLTPVLLELGGQNPTFVTNKFNVKLATKRILWGKIHNCGQICISPNHAIIDRSIETEFVQGCAEAIKNFLPNGAKDPINYGKIINEHHWDRISAYLDNTQGKIVLGGGRDRSELWIEPTIVKVTSLDDPLFKGEIFGPILPFITVEGGPAAMVEVAKKISQNPLAMYPFSNDKKETDYFLNHIRSGGASINDTMIHGAIPTMQFGGIGESGSGCWRGKYTFDAFTHVRATITQKSWVEGQFRTRYPPYSPELLKKYLSKSGPGEPNFDRNCNEFYASKLWRLILLGGKSIKSGLLRYIVTFVGMFILRNLLRK